MKNLMFAVAVLAILAAPSLSFGQTQEQQELYDSYVNGPYYNASYGLGIAEDQKDCADIELGQAMVEREWCLFYVTSTAAGDQLVSCGDEFYSDGQEWLADASVEWAFADAALDVAATKWAEGEYDLANDLLGSSQYLGAALLCAEYAAEAEALFIDAGNSYNDAEGAYFDSYYQP
jgi:hypothetical protein